MWNARCFCERFGCGFSIRFYSCVIFSFFGNCKWFIFIATTMAFINSVSGALSALVSLVLFLTTFLFRMKGVDAKPIHRVSLYTLFEYLLLTYFFWLNLYLFKLNNRNGIKRCEICSEPTIKTLEDIIDVILVSLLLILNILHTFLCCFYDWFWTSKYLLGCITEDTVLSQFVIFCGYMSTESMLKMHFWQSLYRNE